MSDVGVSFQSLPIWYTPNAMGSDGQCVEADQPLSFEWNEQNTGGQDANYTDDVYIDGNYATSISATLSAGATDARRATIDGGTPAGQHTAVIIINTGDAVAEGFTQQTINLCAQ
jgi:hypothetical protein